jgi:regulator of sigma E protease
MSSILNTALSILEFVLAFGVLVFLHEFGHFIVARLSHIEVEEFGFCYPPKITKLFRWRGTDFTLNWIPFGGFCRMKGESGDVNEPGSFMAAKPLQRLFTLMGGPVMNLLLGMILITYLIMRVGAADPTRVQITGVDANSPAATANLQVGDIIQSINNSPVVGLDSLSSLIKMNLGKPTELSLLRGSQTIQVELVPRANPPAGEGAMGIAVSNPTIKVSFFKAIPSAFLSTMDQGVQLVMLPVKLISGQIAPASARVVSVKGLYDIFNQVKTVDAQDAAANPSTANLNTISYLAILSIALGFTNLLPIPALDGGRILFVLPELLFKKKVRPELENKIHMIGYSILMLLMVVLVINDIINPIKLP